MKRFTALTVLVATVALLLAAPMAVKPALADDWKYENGVVTDGMMAFPDFEMMLLYHYGRKAITHWGAEIVMAALDIITHPGVNTYVPKSDPDFWGVD